MQVLSWKWFSIAVLRASRAAHLWLAWPVGSKLLHCRALPSSPVAAPPHNM